jgi:hypothetical protein
MITPEQLAEWKKLAAEATSGPWEFRATPDSSGIQFVVAPNGPKSSQGFEFIAADCSHKNNGQFIAAAREALPMLIEEVERLREMIKKNCMPGCNNVLHIDLDAGAKARGVLG